MIHFTDIQETRQVQIILMTFYLAQKDDFFCFVEPTDTAGTSLIAVPHSFVEYFCSKCSVDRRSSIGHGAHAQKERQSVLSTDNFYLKDSMNV